MNKKIFLLTLAITIIGTGIISLRNVSAQETTGQDHMASLVQKIADTFGLDKTQVQALFDQDRQERQTEMETKRAEMEANMETKLLEQLNQAVTDGKLTEAQKQLVLDKRTELKTSQEANRDAMKDLSEDERKTKMESEKEALKTWAEINGIDEKYLMLGMGRGGRGHMGSEGELPQMPPEEAASQDTANTD